MKKFTKFQKLNENNSKKITVFRLLSHNVIDLDSIGKYWVSNKNDLDPKKLIKQNDIYYAITADINESNIDLDKSNMESKLIGVDSVIVLKDDKDYDLIKLEIFKK